MDGSEREVIALDNRSAVSNAMDFRYLRFSSKFLAIGNLIVRQSFTMLQ